ncbi:putative C2H2 transcription factor [Aspergillus saccharolyticus JOP 1030-1]|uniref:C2H2-type domain-containing protein n=1 Tax=Aspergillus saccharolyticus JOP 1030-1 TaxID=1450539 RepID=A0A318ZQY8_9EURO|nr:hypothetical protein BP01DRAFT_362031 [Aspergillus saccharolyticus JOP 1030-1]PYH50021.1 hypothetical protein BP01DRAFT_362031 [Aspergillus saccharolyticus JOP 1030-1]
MEEGTDHESAYNRVSASSEPSMMTSRTMTDNRVLLVPGSFVPSTMSLQMQPHLLPAATFHEASLSAIHGVPGNLGYTLNQPHGRNPGMDAVFFQQGPYMQPFLGQNLSSSTQHNMPLSAHSLASTSSQAYHVRPGGWSTQVQTRLQAHTPTPEPNAAVEYHFTTPHQHQPTLSQQQLTPVSTSTADFDLDLDLDLDLDFDLDEPPSHPQTHLPHPLPHDNAAATVSSISSSPPRSEHPSNSHHPHRDLTNYGIPNPDGTWRCAFPGCSSQALFRRGCDLRKHYNRHRKHLFCRYEGCPQAVRGGFSSKKDRDRHEAKHNPEIPCEWEGCRRVFSRMDNMKDHVKRIHKRRDT